MTIAESCLKQRFAVLFSVCIFHQGLGNNKKLFAIYEGDSLASASVAFLPFPLPKLRLFLLGVVVSSMGISRNRGQGKYHRQEQSWDLDFSGLEGKTSASCRGTASSVFIPHQQKFERDLIYYLFFRLKKPWKMIMAPWRNCRIWLSPVKPKQEMEFNKVVFSFYYVSHISELQVIVCLL